MSLPKNLSLFSHAIDQSRKPFRKPLEHHHPCCKIWLAKWRAIHFASRILQDRPTYNLLQGRLRVIGG